MARRDDSFFAKQFLPRTNIGIDAMNCGLDLSPYIAHSDPDDSETSFLVDVNDPDNIARSQFNIEPGEKGAAQADLAGLGFLNEAISLGVDAPNNDGESHSRARFVAAFDASQGSHNGLFTVALRARRVKGFRGDREPNPASEFQFGVGPKRE